MHGECATDVRGMSGWVNSFNWLSTFSVTEGLTGLLYGRRTFVFRREIALKEL